MTRSCVVTGGAGSIGQGIITELRAEGWAVVSLDLRPCPLGEDVISVVGDVSDRASHVRAREHALALGPLQGWVNCAGYNIFGSVTELDDEALSRGVGVNLLGVFLGTAAAVEGMLALDRTVAPGAIVNISSIQASVGFPGFAAYAMTKGGIEALTRQVAAEYITQGIRCNAVAPGLVGGDMNRHLLETAEDPQAILAAWRQITPIGRWGTPADIGNAVVFLLGERSSFITGEVLAVNGGALTIAPGQLP